MSPDLVLVLGSNHGSGLLTRTEWPTHPGLEARLRPSDQGTSIDRQIGRGAGLAIGAYTVQAIPDRASLGPADRVLPGSNEPGIQVQGLGIVVTMLMGSILVTLSICLFVTALVTVSQCQFVNNLESL